MCKSIWSSLKEIKIKSWKVIGGSVVKNLPANAGETQETQSQSLDQEDPLEEGMAIHSNILAWRIPWTEESGRLQSMESWRFEHNRVTEHTHTPHTHTHTHTQGAVLDKLWGRLPYINNTGRETQISKEVNYEEAHSRQRNQQVQMARH